MGSQAAQSQVGCIEPLRPEDIADTVAYIVTRNRRVAVSEVLVRASEQTWLARAECARTRAPNRPLAVGGGIVVLERERFVI
ncbi:MAG TPA: hypothetical protein VN695_18970 [Streptosporangiaceae bacterium]|nr:hypothetical protein [Streptosporangiaceae bacterium]